MSLDREKLKKLAEAAGQIDWSQGYLADETCKMLAEFERETKPAKILALLSELEQAERERDAAIEMQCKLEHDLDDQDQAVTRLEKLLEASEAALRTLREAAIPFLELGKAKGYAETGGK